VLGGYLLLTAPVILGGSLGFTHLAVLAAHLSGAGALALLAGRRRAGTVGRPERAALDLAPLVLPPLLYAELPLLMEGMPGPVVYHDPLIAGLERRLFGGEPAFEWAGAWPFTPFSELLHACYASYWLMIFLPPASLWLGLVGRDRAHEERARAFAETVLALELSFFLCFVVFIAYPVQGPRYLGVPSGIPDGPMRRLVLTILRAGSSRGAAFPSAHVAVSVTQAAMWLRHTRRLGWIAPTLALGVAAGAVYGGFHYAIDAMVGAAVGVAAVVLADAVRRRAEAGKPGFTWHPDAA
jgi:membrane-associated phospholipid phosphatase